MIGRHPGGTVGQKAHSIVETVHDDMNMWLVGKEERGSSISFDDDNVWQVRVMNRGSGLFLCGDAFFWSRLWWEIFGRN